MKTSLLLSLSLLLVTGCSGEDDKTDSAVDTATTDTGGTDTADTDSGDTGVATDGDGDGFTADQGDCDDANADVNPGAAETCNGTDDDCDGDTDEDATDATTTYADEDGDGFGAPGTDLTACVTTGARVLNADDCDDTNAAAFPGNAETCDDADNDCDGNIDDEAVDATTFHADTDGDGFGDSATTVAACVAPIGFVADASDCDDADALTNPAALELCGGGDENCDGAVDEATASDALTFHADTDVDGYGDAFDTSVACTAPDGYTDDASDCDDLDPLANPGALEVCGGVDENCDGTTDEASAVDAARWFADADTDGFGDAGSAAFSCTVPIGYVADATDCDDARAASFPGAAEACNGTDDDCDGATDESDAIDRSTFYADVDADGYGDVETTALSCSLPAGFTTDATDCDDAAAGVNPGATEVCDPADVDEDCDGQADDDDTSTSSASKTLFGADADADGYTTSTTRLACEAPAGFAVASTDADCDDGSTTVNPGAAEVCGDGIDNDCATDATCDVTGTYALTAANFIIPGTTAGDRLGANLTADGDLNGDGVDDLVVGMPQTSTSQGKVYVWYGPISASDSLSTADVTISGGEGSEQLGLGAVDILDDIDGDDKDELLVGSPYRNPSSLNDGGTGYLFKGSALTASMTGTGSFARFNGGAANDLTSFSMTDVGDVDDDGVNDIIVGSYQAGATDAGQAHLFSVGSLTTGGRTVTSSSAYTAQFTGATTGDVLGYAITGGDMDGDGVSDLAIGAPNNVATNVTPGSAGYVLVQYGRSGLTGSYNANLGDPTSDADAWITGLSGADRFGYSVSYLGDADGDGYGDLAIAADQRDGTTTDDGTVYLVSGGTARLAGATSVSAASSVSITRETSGAASEYVGRQGVRGGDFNNDGVSDLFVGVPQNDAGGSGAGAVYVVYGPITASLSLTSADAKLRGVAASDAVGRIGGLGDLDNDGYDDLPIGVTAYDPSILRDAGGVFIFLGDGE